jgi:outer membrane protein
MPAPSPLAAAAGTLLAFAALVPAGAQQTAPPPSQAPSAQALPTASNAAGPALSLEEAVAAARRNNPQFLVAENGRRRASATLLGANGALLPSFNLGIGSGFREGRAQFFAGQAFGNTAGTLSSDWAADASLNYSVGILANRRAARAGVEAAEADIGGAAANLRATVTQQYINALQQDARVRLQDTLLVTARAQLELARARAQVGVGTVLDVRRAEVTVGQTEVARLQAANQAEIERLRLYQQMGVEPRGDARLTTGFALTAFPLTLDALLTQARQANPTLGAFRARERAAGLDVRAAQSQYLPALNVRAGIGGFTQQSTDISQAINQRQAGAVQQVAQCQSQAQLYQRVGAAVPAGLRRVRVHARPGVGLRSANRAYPFNFTRNPYNLSVGLSLPVFNGFQREQQVQTATAAERDAEYRRREQELRLSADVTIAYRTLVTDQRSAELQQRTRRSRARRSSSPRSATRSARPRSSTCCRRAATSSGRRTTTSPPSTSTSATSPRSRTPWAARSAEPPAGPRPAAVRRRVPPTPALPCASPSS